MNQICIRTAIGDLHGDAAATRKALRLARVLHPSRDVWVGGRTVVVQVGDQLDRGDDELEVLSLLDCLSRQARAAGGALEVLCGNHEIMAAQGNFRYSTRFSVCLSIVFSVLCLNPFRNAFDSFALDPLPKRV